MKAPLLLLAFLVVSFLAKGMGYPQDMFAEHMVAKAASSPREVKRASVRAKECTRESGAKTSVSPAPVQPQKISYSRPAQPGVPQVGWIAIRKFDLSSNTMEEFVLPLEEFVKEECPKWTVSALLNRLQRQLSACFF